MTLSDNVALHRIAALFVGRDVRKLSGVELEIASILMQAFILAVRPDNIIKPWEG